MAKKERRSPKEVIEQEGSPKVEHAYVKFPYEELVNVDLYSDENFVDMDLRKLRILLEEHKDQPYIGIHTHTVTRDGKTPLSKAIHGKSLPSYGDIIGFLKDRNMKMDVIATRDVQTKDVRGYFVLKKGRKSKKIRNSKRSTSTLMAEFSSYDKAIKDPKSLEVLGELKKITEKYGLKYRIIPAKGYEFDKENFSFESLEKESDYPKARTLETQLASIIAIAGIGVGIFFLSPNLTGNAIANLTTKTSSLIGAGLFIIGIVGSYFWFKKH